MYKAETVDILFL